MVSNLIPLSARADQTTTSSFPNGYMTRVSVDSAGAEGNGQSGGAAISADSHYVFFGSDSPNLVPGDTNGEYDVFRKNVQTGEIVLVSVSSNGEQANGPSGASSISADGRYVAFSSAASNLVPGDTNGVSDIFRKDMQTGDIVRVSVDSSGGQANTASSEPSISSSGQYVAYTSTSTHFNFVKDIFRKDLSSGESILVSADANATSAYGYNAEPSISGSGQYVAFSSDSSALVPGDTNGCSDIFRKNCLTGAIVRISVDAAGGEANNFSIAPAISANGRYVAFQSRASN